MEKSKIKSRDELMKSDFINLSPDEKKLRLYLEKNPEKSYQKVLSIWNTKERIKTFLLVLLLLVIIALHIWAFFP